MYMYSCRDIVDTIMHMGDIQCHVHRYRYHVSAGVVLKFVHPVAGRYGSLHDLGDVSCAGDVVVSFVHDGQCDNL